MRIEVLIPEDRPRRWHLDVIERIAAAGTTVGVTPVAADPTPAGLDLLFTVERLVSRHAESLAVDPVPIGRFAAWPSLGRSADLTVDLTGGAVADDERPQLRFACSGLPPTGGAVAALLDGTSPVLEAEIVETGGSRIVERWIVAVEDRRRAIAAVSQILARLGHLARVVVGRRIGSAGVGPEREAIPEAEPIPPIAGGVAALARATLGERLAARLTRRLKQPEDWRTVTRLRNPGTAPERPEDDATPFAMVPDDGRRFYADPFPWRHDGRTLLYVEEFPYATGRGILSVAEVDADGRPGPLVPFLEADCHLSYPQVFAVGDTTFMIPETTGRRTVELWRAVRMPDRWELDRVLIDGIELHDPTVIEIDGRWFLHATGREPGCSSWDALHVWSAPRLEGPWSEVGSGPLIVDAGSVRPAGRPFGSADGGFLRPVQDCAAGYGAALAIARFDPADPAGERIERRLVPPTPWTGLHTWNRCGHGDRTFEAMDLFGPARGTDATVRLFSGDGGAAPADDTAST